MVAEALDAGCTLERRVEGLPPRAVVLGERPPVPNVTGRGLPGQPAAEHRGGDPPAVGRHDKVGRVAGEQCPSADQTLRRRSHGNPPVGWLPRRTEPLRGEELLEQPVQGTAARRTRDAEPDVRIVGPRELPGVPAGRSRPEVKVDLVRCPEVDRGRDHPEERSRGGKADRPTDRGEGPVGRDDGLRTDALSAGETDLVALYSHDPDRVTQLGPRTFRTVR